MTTDHALDDGPCEVAVITPHAAEAESLAARLDGCIANRASGFTAHIGGLFGHQVAVAATDGRTRNTPDVLDAVLAAHRPRLVVSAGLASGIAPPARRHAVVVASEVVDGSGKRLALAEGGWRPPGGVSGSIVSLDRPLRSLAEKRAAAERYRAIAVERQAFIVAEICAQEGVPFVALCAVTDGPDEELPSDIRRLLGQKSPAGKAGAFTGTLFRSPSHLKHLWRLKASALEAADKLADALVRLVQDLPRPAE